MTRIVLVVCVVLMALLGLLGWRLKSVQAERDTLRDRIAEVEQTNRALVAAGKVHRAARALADRQRKEAENALGKALEQNPDWAGQRVPDDVARALGVQYPSAEGEPVRGHPDIPGANP